MNPLGYDLTFGAPTLKAASLTTGVQPDGTYEFFGHLQAGPGIERHIHGWALLGAEGMIIRGGARLKEDRDTHLGSGISISHSTQEIARFRIDRTTDGIATRLIQCIDDSWKETSQSTWSGQLRRRSVQLPGSEGARGADYSLSMFDAAVAPSSNSSTVVLPFSGSVPFGVSLTLLNRW